MNPVDYDKYCEWIDSQPEEFIAQVWEEGFAEALHPGCGFDRKPFGVKEIVYYKRKQK